MNNHIELNSQRIDVWLWHARLYKTRTLSHNLVKKNLIKINGKAIIKPAIHVKKDDIITIPWQNYSRVFQVLNFAKQRVPAKLCPFLYKEILEK